MNTDCIPQSVYTTFLLLFVMLSSAFGQRDNEFSVGLNGLYVGEAINVYDLSPREAKGSFYYFDKWSDAAIKLKDGRTLTGYKIMYNIETFVLELNVDGVVLELPGSNVEEFYLDIHKEGGFTSRKHFVNTGVKYPAIDGVTGFLEVVVEGDLTLLATMETKLVKAYYVPALDAGDKRPKIVKKESFYLYNGKKVLLLPSKRKKAKKLLLSKYPRMKKYIKENRPDYKKKADLTKLVTFYNLNNR